MPSIFSENAIAVEAQVIELLTAAGWKQRRFGCAASGSFYVGKTGTISLDFPGVGEFIGLWCDWSLTGAIQLWPATFDAERIANEALAAAAAAKYPAFAVLTNCEGERNVDNIPEHVFKQVPFEDGPGDVRPYLVSIEGRYYVLGNLEVSYQDPMWDGMALPTEAVVTKACEAAIIAMRATAAPGVIVYPLDTDAMPGRCTISAALPVRDDSPAAVKERLANTFRGYEDTDKLIALAA